MVGFLLRAYSFKPYLSTSSPSNMIANSARGDKPRTYFIGWTPGLPRVPSYLHSVTWRLLPYRISYFNPNLANSCSPINYMYIAVGQSFLNFARSSVVMLPCSVRYIEKISQLTSVLWTRRRSLISFKITSWWWNMIYVSKSWKSMLCFSFGSR